MGTDIILARRFAEQALMARLPHAPAEKLAMLRGRIAAIRAGLLDKAPEVQSALLAVRFFGQPQHIEQTVTDSSALNGSTVCAGPGETVGRANEPAGGGR